MAITQEAEEMRDRVSSGDLDIEELVGEATWKDILIELVRKEKLDPWDIDIIDVVDRYVAAVREMKVLDLRVPANIMLAAAMLLRFKSDVLLYEEKEAVASEEAAMRPDVPVEPLTFRLRLPPKRRLTLAELVSALDEAMKLKEARETARTELRVSFPLLLEEPDIEEEIERVYSAVVASADSSRMVTFSALLREAAPAQGSSDVLVGLFIPLLFLAHKGRVTLVQERFFGEIIIALN